MGHQSNADRADWAGVGFKHATRERVAQASSLHSAPISKLEACATLMRRERENEKRYAFAKTPINGRFEGFGERKSLTKPVFVRIST